MQAQNQRAHWPSLSIMLVPVFGGAGGNPTSSLGEYVKTPYQDQLSIVAQFSGPSGFGPVSFLQRLLAADLTVRFPLGEALRS